MQHNDLQQLISRSRGIDAAEQYSQFRLNDTKPLVDTARDVMTLVRPSPGDCALLSAYWARVLEDDFALPAIVVAGGLRIGRIPIFKCKRNLPQPSMGGRATMGKWSGHCWIEIDGLLGDLSLFRTAYATQGPNPLKDFVLQNFGEGRGALLGRRVDLPAGMKYIRKHVLSDGQIDGLVGAVEHRLKSGG